MIGLTAMSPAIFQLLEDYPRRTFEKEQIVMQEGEHTGLLLVLIRGLVAITKNQVQLGTSAEPGAIFGELSFLLGGPHTATVRAMENCEFYVVENPKDAMKAHPALCYFICEMLARRLDLLNKYLVDVKRQYSGHDHLGMVDEVLDTLMQKPARRRIRPQM